MSIPLDRLYHYIESVASNICKDNVLIYRFWPHGSKKIEDLTLLDSENNNLSWKQWHTTPVIHCNDQEPLDFKMYQEIDQSKTIFSNVPEFKDVKLPTLPDHNLTVHAFNIHDKSIILHSEQRSSEMDLYSNSFFVPVYYWSHAVISLDWYRYARHVSIKKTPSSTRFLIYNRAWSNTREYRLKFLDLLVDNQLLEHCRTSLQAIEPQLNLHYQDYDFKNTQWKPLNTLENYFPKNNAGSHYSANIDINDYRSTDIEVVLETLFDDSRLHLTEKSLRPIACKQPFILVATHGSLEYLRSYGFKTFDGIIDETYDLIQDPRERLDAVISTMQQISFWTEKERKTNLDHLQQIAEYNHQHFFSKEFFNLIIDELKLNLTNGLDILKNTNTGHRFIELRKALAQHELCKKTMTTDDCRRSRQDITDLLKIVQQCKNNLP